MEPEFCPHCHSMDIDVDIVMDDYVCECMDCGHTWFVEIDDFWEDEE